GPGAAGYFAIDGSAGGGRAGRAARDRIAYCAAGELRVHLEHLRALWGPQCHTARGRLRTSTEGLGTTMKRLAFLTALAAAAFVPQPGRVLVLEDFETPGAEARWEGGVQAVAEHASHGAKAGRVRLDPRNPQF